MALVFDPRQAFHPIPQNPQMTTVEVITGCGGDSPPAGDMRAATLLPGDCQSFPFCFYTPVKSFRRSQYLLTDISPPITVRCFLRSRTLVVLSWR